MHILKVSPLLEKFQRLIQTLFPKVRLPGLVRVSLGIENCEADVDTLLQVLGKIAGKRRALANQQPASADNGIPVLPKAVVLKQMNDHVRDSALRVYSKL